MANVAVRLRRAILLLGLTGALALPTSAESPTSTPFVGRERPGYLGFGYDYALPKDSESETGSMFVRFVMDGGPAEQAGLKTQDVIDAIGGKPLRFEDELDLLMRLAEISQGDRVAMSVRRGAKTVVVNITAGAMSAAIYDRWKKNFEIQRARKARRSR